MENEIIEEILKLKKRMEKERIKIVTFDEKQNLKKLKTESILDIIAFADLTLISYNKLVDLNFVLKNEIIPKILSKFDIKDLIEKRDEYVDGNSYDDKRIKDLIKDIILPKRKEYVELHNIFFMLGGMK